MAWARGSCRWISRLNVAQLSQTVEGLELVFGEWLGGRGVKIRASTRGQFSGVADIFGNREADEQPWPVSTATEY
jgi:hypothetical protein